MKKRGIATGGRAPTTVVLRLWACIWLWLSSADGLTMLPSGSFHAIQRGGVVVIEDFLSPNELSALRADAMALHRDDNFIVDGLSNYGKKEKFDPAKDRMVLPNWIPSKKVAGPWADQSLGDAAARKGFAAKMTSLREELSAGLGRPGLGAGDPAKYEISYTRYGPGAGLIRHIDEHHEELKGKRGWAKPTRRSVSWLVYLNDEWDMKQSGGHLRTYTRRTAPATDVGSRANGDLQIGWLRSTTSDPLERPVFLDARRPHQDGEGNCAMYIADNNDAPLYITDDFFAEPVLFLVSDFFVQKLIEKHGPNLGSRFRYLEQARSPAAAFVPAHADEEQVMDVNPQGGTLVLFDSVGVPHEVMPTIDRERFACSGWFHDKQQPHDPDKQVV